MACPRCTFLNTNVVRCCSMCGTRLSPSVVNTVQCPTCTLMNSPESSSCVVCYTVLKRNMPCTLCKELTFNELCICDICNELKVRFGVAYAAVIDNNKKIKHTQMGLDEVMRRAEEVMRRAEEFKKYMAQLVVVRAYYEEKCNVLSRLMEQRGHVDNGQQHAKEMHDNKTEMTRVSFFKNYNQSLGKDVENDDKKKCSLCDTVVDTEETEKEYKQFCDGQMIMCGKSDACARLMHKVCFIKYICKSTSVDVRCPFCRLQLGFQF